MADIRRLSPPGLKDDLPLEPDEEKNWVGLFISVLVISIIMGLIGLSIMLLSPHVDAKQKKEMLKLEDFILEGYEVRRYNGTWIGPKEILYKELNGSICIYNVETSHKELVLDGALTRQYEVQQYSISNDHRYLLLMHDIKMTGSYSSLSRYTVFDTRLHMFTQLRLRDQTEADMHQYGAWVPDHSLIILINQNNIYLMNPLGEVQHILTESGRPDLVYNGIPDISYEEHIWHTNNGIWLKSYQGGWAMIYSTIDSSQVEKVPYIWYENPNDTFNQASLLREKPSKLKAFSRFHQSFSSPKLFFYPYPKPGKQIPRLTLNVIKMNDRNEIVYKQKPVTIPIDKLSENYLSTGPIWISFYEFVAVWTGRSQEFAIIGKCREEPTEWRCERLTEEKQLRPIGSLVLQSKPVVSASGDRLFIKLPVSDGAAGTFDHIAQITMDGKKQFLTHGQYVVTDIFAYREDLKTLYYAANTVEDPGMRHIYSIKHHTNSNEKNLINCISCQINNSCLYNNVKFSTDNQYFVLECLGPDYPKHYLVKTDTEKMVQLLDDGWTLRQWAKNRLMPKIRQFLLKPSSQNMNSIRIQLIIPFEVNELDDARYPLVVETNQSPGTQNVNYLNKLDWSRYLSSRRQYITARIDTRGSGFQGDRHQYSIFKHIGENELEDMKLALNFLKQLSYVDSSKIAVWGREYGGYLAAGLLATDNAVACSAAVSTITSWKNYLSVFSERFMGTPEDNFLSYEKSELMKFSSNLLGRTLLLVHGTIDRRVSVQHLMQFIKSLNNYAVQYRTQLYPDSGSLETWDLLIRYHFYRTLEDFFAKCFQVEDEEEEDELIPITKVIKGKSKTA